VQSIITDRENGSLGQPPTPHQPPAAAATQQLQQQQQQEYNNNNEPLKFHFKFYVFSKSVSSPTKSINFG
jgi:hypothetical protein